MTAAALARASRRALPWLVAAVLAAGGAGVAQLQPDWAARHPRFPVRVPVGVQATTPTMTLEVTDVTVAETLTQEPLDRPSHTGPGVYVVVDLKGEARRETVTLLNSVLRDSHGRRYAQSDGNLETFASVALETQVPLTGTLVFAVPRRALDDGLELVANARTNPDPVTLLDRSYSLRLDQPVIVPLGTGETRVRETYALPIVDFP